MRCALLLSLRIDSAFHSIHIAKYPNAHEATQMLFIMYKFPIESNHQFKIEKILCIFYVIAKQQKSKMAKSIFQQQWQNQNRRQKYETILSWSLLYKFHIMNGKYRYPILKFWFLFEWKALVECWVARLSYGSHSEFSQFYFSCIASILPFFMAILIRIIPSIRNFE